MNDLTIDTVIDVLANFATPIIGPCEQAQSNRVPMNKGPFCLLTPLFFKRLSTSRERHHDTRHLASSTIQFSEVRQADIQIDIFGERAGDRAIALETLWGTAYAYDALKALNPRIAPLYSSAVMQATMIDSEQQWQERYLLTVSLQVHITIEVAQAYFDDVAVSLNLADKAKKS